MELSDIRNDVTKSIQDGVALCRLILSYVPQLQSCLKTLYTEPEDEDQRRHNAVLICLALQKLHLTFSLDCDDILSPSPTYTVLLLRYLRHVLPQIAAEPTQVQLEGRLGQSLKGACTLNNPLDQPCVFRVVSFDCDEFTFEDKVKVPARGSATFQVALAARREHAYEGTLLCVGRVQDSAHLLLVPLRVTADVLARPGATHLSMTTRCYESRTANLMVRNPHTTPTTYRVRLVELTEDRQSERETEGQYPSFWTRTEVLTVPEKGSAAIPISFLPTRLGTHQLAVVIADDAQGSEQCYGVTGISEQPEPLGTFKSYNDLRSPRLQPIQVPLVNEARREALSILSRATSGLSNLQNFSPSTAKVESQSVLLNVGVQGCSHVTAPPAVELHPAKKGSGRRRAGGEVPLTFQPLAAGTYTFDLTLTGPEDTRVYRVEADVVEALNTRLQSRVEPEETTVFRAPITNVCRSRHTYGVELTGHPAFAYQGPQTFQLEPGEERTVEVPFVSDEVGAYHATLTVTDVRADSHSRFSLHANVEQARQSSRTRLSHRRHRSLASLSSAPTGHSTPTASGRASQAAGLSLRVPQESARQRGAAADDEEFEDVIYLPAKGTTRIGFRLNSQAAAPKDCKAWLEPKGLATVSPATAQLPPAGEPGQLFVLEATERGVGLVQGKSEEELGDVYARLHVEVRCLVGGGEGRGDDEGEGGAEGEGG